MKTRKRLGVLLMSSDRRTVAHSPLPSWALVCVLVGLAGCGEGQGCAPPPIGDATVDDTIVSEVEIPSFDPAGKVWLREMRDGSLQLVFEFMPPSNEGPTGPNRLGRFENFDQVVAQAVGVPVSWEDRESFVFKHPNPDTADRVRAFVANYKP
jgi:hypothetical protein